MTPTKRLEVEDVVKALEDNRPKLPAPFSRDRTDNQNGASAGYSKAVLVVRALAQPTDGGEDDGEA